jgi:glycosyltransferase involved in cell wall biosynthesis
VLKHYRPDLDIRIYDIEMKGLAIVSNLDPASRALADNYARIEAELSSGMWQARTIDELRKQLAPRSADTLEGDLRALAKNREVAAGQGAPHARYQPSIGTNNITTGKDASRPRLSVIICTHNMVREAPRTILSSSLPYQKGIKEGDFEVIVVDNGSTQHFSRENLPVGVKVVDMPSPRPSPVFAMNWAAREVAQGDILLFAIDGARIFSDRLLSEMLRAHAAFEDAFVYTLSWHLGPKVQMKSVKEGYNQVTEDRLIAQSGWPHDPDGLFSISVFAGSSAAGFFGEIAESNAFSISRRLFEQYGGYDERFTSPGGGLANLEIFARYATRPNARNICLLSEGTFHQVHGGIATNGIGKWEDFAWEYAKIFGKSYTRPKYDVVFFGKPRASMLTFFTQSISCKKRPVTKLAGFRRSFSFLSRRMKAMNE